MARIHIGALQPGARPVGIGVTGARRGVAMFDGAPRGVIVKGCSHDELAVECFCALLANDLLVNAPECGLVLDPDTGTWLFASIDVQVPNLMQALSVTSPPTERELKLLAAELVAWAGFSRLVALDVLVRNADRNAGNLLTDGQHWWAIDHARSMNLFPWNGHALYRLVKAVDPARGNGVEAGAISNALTFLPDCHTLSVEDLVEVGFHREAADMATQIVNRLPSLASTMGATL
jgi:hypothetical protein